MALSSLSKKGTIRRTTPRNMKMAGRASGLVTQAFRYLGKDPVTQTAEPKVCPVRLKPA